MPRRTLIVIVVALCSGAAQAQYAGGGVPGGAGAGSAAISAPAPSASTSSPSSGTGLNLQNTIGARCESLKNENIVSTGGLSDANMKAKAEHCKWAESIPLPN